MTEKVTAHDIKSALATRYSRPEWCVFFEVADQSGGYSKRYADAVAMSIWPSRGYQIHGFEIKVSRSDFVNEMRDPNKADAVGQYCDYWWLVTPPRLVEAPELPEAWGLMVRQKNGLRVVKQAPKKPTSQLDRGFAAALLRRSMDLQSSHVRMEVEKGNAERQKQVAEVVARRTKQIAADEAKHREWIERFEATLGSKFSVWEAPDRLAASLKLARLLGDEYSHRSLERLLEGSKGLAQAIEEFKGIGGPVPVMTEAEADQVLRERASQ